jgi:thioredoxin 1
MAQPKVVKSHAEFTALLNSTTFVVVDFHATWCGPCHAIAPIYAQLASTYSIPGVLEFAKVDVDELSSVAAENGVTAMPTFKFFQGGKPYGPRTQIRGADPRGLRATVEELAKLANVEVARKASREEEERQPAEDTQTVSGGYTIGSQSGSRSDWKTSLRG